MSHLVDKYKSFENGNSTKSPLPVPDSWEKGRQFEEYIINLFHKNRFRVNNWRTSHKSNDRSFLENCLAPDIEMLFFSPFRGRIHRFAVECKWRREFIDGRITWANDEQIWSYIDFEQRQNISVYVAIGVGGHPSDPYQLFVTPLRNISHSAVVYEHELIPFNRHPKRGFFYDPRQLKLF